MCCGNIYSRIDEDIGKANNIYISITGKWPCHSIHGTYLLISGYKNNLYVQLLNYPSFNIVHLCCCQAGLRQLVSWDLDTEWAEFVQFYLRVGGDWAECNQADSREEGVLLQYSNDGGISWGLIAEMYFTDFTKPR